MSDNTNALLRLATALERLASSNEAQLELARSMTDGRFMADAAVAGARAVSQELDKLNREPWQGDGEDEEDG